MGETLSPADAAIRLSVSKATILRWIKIGKLEAMHLTKRTIRIPVEALANIKAS